MDEYMASDSYDINADNWLDWRVSTLASLSSAAELCSRIGGVDQHVDKELARVIIDRLVNIEIFDFEYDEDYFDAGIEKNLEVQDRIIEVCTAILIGVTGAEHYHLKEDALPFATLHSMTTLEQNQKVLAMLLEICWPHNANDSECNEYFPNYEMYDSLLPYLHTDVLPAVISCLLDFLVYSWRWFLLSESLMSRLTQEQVNQLFEGLHESFLEGVYTDDQSEIYLPYFSGEQRKIAEELWFADDI